MERGPFEELLENLLVRLVAAFSLLEVASISEFDETGVQAVVMEIAIPEVLSRKKPLCQGIMELLVIGNHLGFVGSVDP
jgi:hypothetical protein